MAHSYADIATLTCPQCEQEFQAQVWLIVDAAERSDLLECVVARTLHLIPCSNCDTKGFVDLPLLIYRPDNIPPLLFSPAEDTTAEQDQEDAMWLTTVLHEQLGNAWRDDWMADGLLVLSRGQLVVELSRTVEEASTPAEASAADSSSDDRLGRALWELFQASHLDSYKEVIRQNPELLTADADRRLASNVAHFEAEGGELAESIIRKLQYHRMILSRCRRLGVDHAFRPKSTLEMLYEFANGNSEQMECVHNLPQHIRDELDNQFSLRELLDTSFREQSVAEIIDAVGMRDLHSLIMVSALGLLRQAHDVKEMAWAVQEYPELLGPDVQVLLDAIFENARTEIDKERWGELRDLLVRWQEFGSEAAVREGFALEEIEQVCERRAKDLGLQGDESREVVIGRVKEYAAANPDWLDEIAQGNPVLAAMAAMAEMAREIALTREAPTLVQLLQMVNQHPTMLTRQFDNAYAKGLSITAVDTPPDGTTRSQLHAFVEVHRSLLSLVRRLRGLGLNSEHIARLRVWTSSEAFPENAFEYLDVNQPEDRMMFDAIQLRESPLPLLACDVMDGRMELEAAIRSVVEQGILSEIDDNTVEIHNRHLVSLLHTEIGDLHAGYILSELNHAVSSAKCLERLRAETAGTLRDCARSLAIRVQSPQERSRLAYRSLSAAQTAVENWKVLESETECANAQFLLGATYLWLPIGGRFENLRQAISYFQEASSKMAAFASPQQTAHCLYELGVAYSELTDENMYDNLERAIAYFEAGLKNVDPQSDAVLYIAVQNGLGATCARFAYARGEYLQRAIACHKEVLARSKELGLTESRIQALLNLGASYSSLPTGDHQSNLRMARGYLEEAIHLCSVESFPMARDAQGKAWANLATVYSELSEHDRADNLRKAITCIQSAQKALRAAVSSWDAELLAYNLGSLYSKLFQLERNPEYFDQARKHLEHAAENYRRLGGIRQQLGALSNLGWLYRSKASDDQAECSKNLEQAAQVLGTAFRLCNPIIHVEETATTAQALGDLYFENPALLPHPWSEAGQTYLAAIQASEQVYLGEATLEARQPELRKLANLARRCAYSLARSDRLVEAVETLELGRTRTMALAFSLDTSLLGRLREKDRKAFEATRAQISYLEAEDRKSSYTQSDDVPQSRLELSAQLRRARAELDQIVDRIHEYEPDFLPAKLDFGAIANASPDPVIYLVTTSQGSLALIVPPASEARGVQAPVWLDGFNTHSLGELLWHEDTEGLAVGGYLAGQGSVRSELLKVELESTLPALGEQLIGPIAARLADLGYQRVTLIPVGELALLPWHAARYLVNGSSRCFLDDFEIAYAPSVRALAASRRAVEAVGVHAPSLLAVGDPTHRSARRLAFAYGEVEEIATLFSAGASQPLYEEQATRDAVRRTAPCHTYLHFSCHGSFSPSNPLHSALLLAGDERLTLMDILDEANLAHARLAVLSACQTAISDFRHLPDEVLGLPAGFLQAGVPGVVGTLWPVNDLSTMLLMVRFYQYHLHGDKGKDEGPMAPAGALRRAQLWLRDVTCGELTEMFDAYLWAAPGQSRMKHALAREQRRVYFSRESSERPFAHPYYWAPFALYGC